MLDLRLFRGFQKFIGGVGVGSAADPFKPSVVLTDGLGNPLSSFYHASTDKYILNIHDADVHNRPVNELFHKHLGVASTLTVATNADGSDYTITVANGAIFSVGDDIQIGTDATHAGIKPRIIAIATNVLTLDTRVDALWPIGSLVETISYDLRGAVGTIAAPIKYIALPSASQVIHITRILISMTHGTAGDLGLFGNQAALTNGVVLRAFVGGQYGTFTNWKSNADIKNDMFDLEFDVRSGGGGTHGTSGRGSFSRIGVAVRLDGDAGDFMELYIQDDLTNLTSFKIKAQGHIES